MCQSWGLKDSRSTLSISVNEKGSDLNITQTLQKSFWLTQEGTDIIIVGWRIALARHVTIKKLKSLKGQMSCNALNSLSGETYCG